MLTHCIVVTHSGGVGVSAPLFDLPDNPCYTPPWVPRGTALESTR